MWNPWTFCKELLTIFLNRADHQQTDAMGTSLKCWESHRGHPPQNRCNVRMPPQIQNAGLVFVAWPHASLNFPRLTQRLGIVFCVNRPCFLYHIASAQDGSFSSQVSRNSGMMERPPEAARHFALHASMYPPPSNRPPTSACPAEAFLLRKLNRPCPRRWCFTSQNLMNQLCFLLAPRYRSLAAPQV